MIDRQKIFVLWLFSTVHLLFSFKGREYYKHMTTDSITWSATDSRRFDEMLDYWICNVT